MSEAPPGGGATGSGPRIELVARIERQSVVVDRDADTVAFARRDRTLDQQSRWCLAVGQHGFELRLEPLIDRAAVRRNDVGQELLLDGRDAGLDRLQLKRLGLTQAQLASLIGISRPQLANVTPDDVSASEP
jgi:hypothetical protein